MITELCVRAYVCACVCAHVCLLAVAAWCTCGCVLNVFQGVFRWVNAPGYT